MDRGPIKLFHNFGLWLVLAQVGEAPPEPKICLCRKPGACCYPAGYRAVICSLYIYTKDYALMGLTSSMYLLDMTQERRVLILVGALHF